MRSTDRTWRRRIGTTCTTNGSATGSTAISTASLAAGRDTRPAGARSDATSYRGSPVLPHTSSGGSPLPFDLGVRAAHVEGLHVPRGGELLPLDPGGRELDQRGGAGGGEPGPGPLRPLEALELVPVGGDAVACEPA